MRTFLSTLFFMTFLFALDVNVATLSVGFTEAKAADFTGKIKRVKIRRKRVGSSFQVVTESPTGPNSLASTMQVALEPMSGASPIGLTSDVAENFRDNVRFSYEISSDVALSDMIVSIITQQATTEVSLEALLSETEPENFGPNIAVNGADAVVRARETIDNNGIKGLDLRLVSKRGTLLDMLEKVELKSFSDADGSATVLAVKKQSSVRIFEVDLNENSDETLLGSYTAQAMWRDLNGELIDETQVVLNEGETDAAQIERVVLKASSRGTTLLTQISTPDASAILLEASVTETDGSTVISAADETPQWTERQFNAVGLEFEDDPTGSTYLAQLTSLDEEGNPTGEQIEVALTAEKPDVNGEINTTLFSDDRAQIALIPGDESGSWLVFIRSVLDVPAVSYNVIFEEPFEGPAPLETELNTEMTRVWRQYRQRNRTPVEGDTLRQVSVLMNTETESSAQASGLEAQGKLMSSGNNVEDIDGFMATLSKPRRSIRAKKRRQVRR